MSDKTINLLLSNDLQERWRYTNQSLGSVLLDEIMKSFQLKDPLNRHFEALRAPVPVAHCFTALLAAVLLECEAIQDAGRCCGIP